MFAGPEMARDGAWIELLPLFADRFDAGRVLAAELERELGPLPGAVVVGLARGGVQVASEVARALGAPLDVLAVRKVGHPWQPEYAIGAVTPGEGVYVRGPDGLAAEQVERAVAEAQAQAAALDGRLHARRPALEVGGRTAVLVDDGLATGATMIAAVRWARARGAAPVVAVPVAAAPSARLLRDEAETVVCPYELEDFWAVGVWYREFAQVDDAEVLRLFEQAHT